MSSSRIVKNVENVQVYGNELLTPYAINRNIKKLLENDEALYGFYKKQFGGLRVTDYNYGVEYALGQLVWYKEPRTGRLYLLKSIIDKNIDEPVMLDGEKFEKSGWTSEAKYLNILKYGICCDLARRASQAYEDHEKRTDLHPFGRISNDPDDDDFIDKKILRKDMTNLDAGRKTNMFPSYMKKMPPQDCVISGTYRRWDCGLVEYDFTFKFTGGAKLEEDCACQKLGAQDKCGCPDENTNVSDNTISANSAVFEATDKNPEIEDYFMSPDIDGSIFAPQTDSYASSVGRIRTLNRNDYVNTYSAVIKFPVKFRTTRYMVYTNNVMCQVEGEGQHGVSPSSNDLVVCDKRYDQMTILNICYPKPGGYGNPGLNAANGGLAANSFHCKVVGECV